MGVAIAPNDHTRVYLITGESLGNDKGFFVSDNGDRSLADGGPTFVAGGHAGANPRFEWWFGRLFVDPVNKNHLFKMDVSLRRSSDGGATWVERRRPARRPARRWRGTRTSPNRVYLGNDGGMYRSDANGDSGWVHGTNMPWLQEYHVAVSQQRPNRIAIGLQDNGSNRSWTNMNDAVADPVAANWTSYGGGDGHYVVIDAHRRHVLLLVQPERRLQRRPRRRARRRRRCRRRPPSGATNVKVASVTGLVVGNTITIDSTGANPETVTMTTVGTSGAGGTGVTFTPALAFAHASGATVVKNGVAGHAEPRLRLARQRPALHDRRAARPGPVELGDALPRLQQPVALDEPRGELDDDRPARPAHRAGAGRRLDEQQPALRGPVPDGLDDRAVEVGPEHDLRRHRQRPALADDRPRRDVAGVPEPVRARPAALGDLGDRRPGRLEPRVRLVRRLPRGLHVGERLRDDDAGGTARPGRT